MKLICGPVTFGDPIDRTARRVILYAQPTNTSQASAGEAILTEIRRRHFALPPRVWDFLSIALSVVTADFSELRNKSPDGWTREFDLHIAVTDVEFWNAHAEELATALEFLTTDRWALKFYEGGALPPTPDRPVRLNEDCVVLLSGGLDSLVGGIDLTTSGRNPFAISQVVRGDAEKQASFAASLGGGLNHLQLNHNSTSPETQETSQRARSLVFITFGILAATTLRSHHEGATIPLYVCENGFISINPPLTWGRIGSLSTRTAHPEFLSKLQSILDSADFRIQIQNPYTLKTKGEMLQECLDQDLLVRQAVSSTSCGRFQRFNYRHCGRCVPCQVRRAAFLTWGEDRDTTEYVYRNLGKNDEEHSGFDDVRSIAMALAAVRADGIESWLSSALSPLKSSEQHEIRFMLSRGLAELEKLHRVYGVR